MFWNNNSSRLKHSASLKFKIAVTYGALFAISFCVIFGLVCGFWVSNTLDMVNQNMDDLSRLYEYEYITGKTLPVYYTATRRKRIPPEVITAVQSQLGEFSPTLLFRDIDSPGNIMMICRRERNPNELYEVLVNPEQRIVVHKITPAFTTVSIQGAARGPMHDQFFGVILEEGKNFPTYARLLPGLQEKLKNEIFDRHSDLVIHYKTLSVENEIYQIGYTYLFDGSLLIVGQDMHGNYEALLNLVVIFAITGGAVILVGLLVGFLMAQKFTAGLKRIQDGAHQIASGDYTVRLKIGNDGLEIDQLANSFNEMVIKTDLLLNEFKNISDNIAHDLKTPLTRILGRAELTVNGPPELKNYQETLSDIGEECNSMLSIINTMLQITKLESGVSPLNCQMFSLNDLGRRLLELFSLGAKFKNQQLIGDISDGEIMINADEVRLRQAVANLLDNAIKFTPENGTIRLSIKCDGAFAVICVADSGIGIKADEMNDIFKRFFRSDSSRSIQGNGLGLSMVQAVVNAHNGNIAVRSVYGEGSTFTIRLPLGGGGAAAN